jgi:hypothetical protein
MVMARSKETPVIADVEAMPERRHGRAAVELEPLIAALQDRQPHALEDIRTDLEKRRWRRKLRRAGDRAGVRVQTRYVESESRLYFQGREITAGGTNGRASRDGRHRSRTRASSRRR